MRIIKKVEQQIWGTITAAANETYTKQYVATWQQISKPVLAPSFDLEVWDFCFSDPRWPTAIKTTSRHFIRSSTKLGSMSTGLVLYLVLFPNWLCTSKSRFELFESSLKTLTLQGETMRSVIERTAQFSINNYLALSQDQGLTNSYL